jgi:hypothetical protein
MEKCHDGFKRERERNKQPTEKQATDRETSNRQRNKQPTEKQATDGDTTKVLNTWGASESNPE